MTRAHLDIQTRFDSGNDSNITDITTTPLFIDSPIHFLEPVELRNTSTYRKHIKYTIADTNSPDKQNETPPKTFQIDQSLEIPPRLKKTFEITKDTAFFYFCSISSNGFFKNCTLYSKR